MIDLSALPASYRDSAFKVPDDWMLLDEIVEPCLSIRREHGLPRVDLAARFVHRDGTAKLVAALSRHHNWVAYDDVIAPMPYDIPEVAARMLGTREAVVDERILVRLLQDSSPEIPLVVDESVYLPAATTAAALAPDITLPQLRATLYPYQARGVRWMQQSIAANGGLLLADEMGLGKTLQAIALLLTDEPTVQSPALIICPTTLIINWVREIERFAPHLSVAVHRGADRAGAIGGLSGAAVLLSTYDTVVRDRFLLQGVNWSWLYCDEAQALKTPTSDRRRCVSSLRRTRCVLITGTPVETSLLDLWSLLDIAIPGLLGPPAEFLSRYSDDEASARALARLAAPLVLNRRVRDVAEDLPPRIDIDRPLELGQELSEEYERVRQEVIANYGRAGALVATGRLQMFCAHPLLVSDSFESDGIDEDADLHGHGRAVRVTPKLEETVRLLEEAFQLGKKVLVFSLFNRCGPIIQGEIAPRNDCYWGAINGSTDPADRMRIVDEFSAHDGAACLVLNPRAAGAGLNITAATVVIHFTQSWNPAIEAQASARAHRRGQDAPVTIYRLFYERTVERVMVDRAAWRREIGNEAVPISTRDADDVIRALSESPRR